MTVTQTVRRGPFGDMREGTEYDGTMMPGLIVFDLDGTLVDSQVDLAHSVNATLLHLGKPELPQAVIAQYIGDGAGMLVRRALGDPEGDVHDEEYVRGALDYFLDYYRVHKLDATYVYEGVFAGLEAVRISFPEARMAVLTNKPVRPSREICAALGLGRYVFQNYGGNSFHTKKPDPTGLEALMREAGVLAGATVMVGDSDVDVLTARNAGVRSAGCLYGLAADRLRVAGPDVLVSSPLEWVGAIAGL